MNAARANVARLFTNQPLNPKPSVISLIKSSTHKSHLLQIHAFLLHHSSLLFDSAVSLHFLSSLLLQSQTLVYPRRFLAHLPNPKPIHYNALIKSHSSSSSPHLGIALFNRSPIRLNSISSFFAIQCCIAMESIQVGVQVYARIVRDGHCSDTRLLTSVMRMFANSGEYLDARKLFDEITVRDCVAWNALLSCCLRNGRSGVALEVFDAMIEDGGCEPDDVTCLLTLQACGNMNAFEFGERFVGTSRRKGSGEV